MVLQNELNNTIENLRRSRKAILGRGGEITETAGLKELPEAIYKIPADASLAYQTDETAAYRKIVPSGAEKYAQISKVGGMSYKDEETGALRNSKVASIVSEGANLLDISKAVNKNFVDNGDGTYTLICTDNNNRFSAKVALNIPANSTITIKATHISGDGKGVMRFTNSDGTDFMHIAVDKYVRTYTIPKDLARMDFYMNASDAGKSVTISEVQVQYGTVTEYKQYIGTLSTFEIPETVQSLEGYGEGVSADYYNYIEWRNGRCYFVQTCKKIIFNGTERWYTASSGTENQYFAIEYYPLNAILNGGIMTDYSATNVNSSNKQIGWQLYKTDKFLLRIRPTNILTDFPSLNIWKAYLAERYSNGNPLTFIYALAEPIETDITDLMGEDNFIEVEGGGSIVATNEHENAIPSKINYIYKVGV